MPPHLSHTEQAAALSAQHGRPGDGHTCTLGHPTRVRDLVFGRTPIPAAAVQRGDLWATEDHCGLVESVTRLPLLPAVIMIRNCSSKQGGVFLNDWASHFKGAGKFSLDALLAGLAGNGKPRGVDDVAAWGLACMVIGVPLALLLPTLGLGLAIGGMVLLAVDRLLLA